MADPELVDFRPRDDMLQNALSNQKFVCAEAVVDYTEMPRTKNNEPIKTRKLQGKLKFTRILVDRTITLEMPPSMGLNKILPLVKSLSKYKSVKWIIEHIVRYP